MSCAGREVGVVEGVDLEVDIYLTWSYSLAWNNVLHELFCCFSVVFGALIPSISSSMSYWREARYIW